MTNIESKTDSQKRRALKDTIITLCIVLVIVYVSSYLCLSRMGYQRAGRYDIDGFYFIEPLGQWQQSANRIMVCAYWPLIKVDVFLGFGRHPASDPMLHLSHLGPWLRVQDGKIAMMGRHHDFTKNSSLDGCDVGRAACGFRRSDPT